MPAHGRVLVVDEEAAVRRSLGAGLKQAGYEVVACRDGLSAIHEWHAAGQKGAGFDGMIVAAYLPDLDGIKLLKAARILHPGLPAVVITRFGDAQLRRAALAEPNTAFLEKPFDAAHLAKALQALTPGPKPAAGVVAAPETAAEEQAARAWLTIRIAEPARSLEIYHVLRAMEGVEVCHAVHGDVDIVLRAKADSSEALDRLTARIRAIQGVEVAAVSPVSRLGLDRGVGEFAEAYRRARGPEAPADPLAGTASCLFVDLEPKALPRVLATVLFADETAACDAADHGRKLVVTIAGLDAGGQARRAIGRIGRIDGVLRVREAKIIRIAD